MLTFGGIKHLCANIGICSYTTGSYSVCGHQLDGVAITGAGNIVASGMLFL
jgi:hypothetical protein